MLMEPLDIRAGWRGEASLQEVCRSRPAFRTRILFASLLFTGLFVADLFLVGHLAFTDLSRQMIDERFRASLETLRPRPIPAQPVSPLEAPPPPATDVECPVDDPVSTDLAPPCNPEPRRSGVGLFRSLTVRLERVLMDTKKRVLWRDFRQGNLLASGDTPETRIGSDQPLLAEEWPIDGSVRPVLALTQPVAPGSADVREVGIPEDLINQELDQLRRSLQRKLWVGASVAVFILFVGFLYVVRLVRRTRLLEAQAQMDDRLAYVGGLAAGLAHEIRNPLNVLSINMQLLEEDLVGRLGGEQAAEARQYLGTLQGEIRRLSNLVDNFLSYARPSQPKFESRDLNHVVAATCLLVRPQFETQGIALVEDLSPFLPVVDLDESQIRQALMNVLMNAGQILKPGGSVMVQTAVSADGGVQVSVTDDGPGIAAADRQRIFEVFYSNRPGGTGLGLAIAARILQAHGGRIEVASGPGGRGARFILRLPRRHAPEGAPTAPVVAVSRGA